MAALVSQTHYQIPTNPDMPIRLLRVRARVGVRFRVRASSARALGARNPKVEPNKLGAIISPRISSVAGVITAQSFWQRGGLSG